MTERDVHDSAPVSSAIFRVARAHKSLAGRLLREAGLHPGQELLLMTLWADGPQRMVDLAAAIESDAPSMTRSIARLERSGLVVRRRSATDGRVVVVEATESSLALRGKVEQAWSELERLTAGSLTASEKAAALDALRLLDHTLASVDS